MSLRSSNDPEQQRRTQLEERLAQEVTAPLIASLENSYELPLTNEARRVLASAIFRYAEKLVLNSEIRRRAKNLEELNAEEIRSQARTGALEMDNLTRFILIQLAILLTLAPATALVNALTFNDPFLLFLLSLLSILGFVLLLIAFRSNIA